ncbi:MAG TPA: hypothetical protein VF864_10040 [Gemmatimonadales bacterium]
MIDVEQHRDHLERLLADLEGGNWVLWIVTSVEDWAASINRPQRRILIPAMAVRASDGRQIVVVRRLLSDNIQKDVLDGFLARGQGDQPELKDPRRFLEHLVLHEVAHHVLDTQDEEPCDAWAFSRMPGRVP